MPEPSDTNWYTQGFLNPNIYGTVPIDEAVGEPSDPLKIETSNDELVTIIDKRTKGYRDYYTNEYDLFDRRKKNEMHLFGRQIKAKEDDHQLKDYEARNQDNVIFEIERTIKPLALSQLPDLIVTAGSNTDQSKQVAKLLTTAVNSDLRKRKNRRVLAMTFKHRSVYFVGVIKCRWDPELAGGMGDYVFEYLHPDTVEFDWTVTVPDADEMSWISHLKKTTIGKLFMQFPKAKDDLIAQLRTDGMMGDNDDYPSEKALATEITIREVWFTDYEQAGDKWKRIEGVCWKYKDVILDKMKNPNFDYEGEKQVFTYDNPMLQSTKRQLTQDEMMQSLLTGVYPQYVKEEQIYHNYFQMPRKPFFFVVYDQWGKQPIDETTHLEQNIRNQNTLDKRGKQIEETLNHRGHHIWSKLGGFKASDIQKMDHNNPDEDYLVDGVPQQVHEFVPAERPGQAEFADLDRTRERMYAISSSTAIRGQLKTDNATTNQIGREANYTVMDDMVEDTINAASEWMAEWSLQMIKTRYTQEHFRKLLGKKGEVIFLTLHQNMIEDGMAVMIKASGTDKIQKKNNAMNMAKLQLIDPLTFFEDMDLDDPEGRAARIITFKTDMPLYVSEFVTTGPTSTPELVTKLSAITQAGTGNPGQLGGGAAPGNPQLPSAGNTAAVPAMPAAGAVAGAVR